MIWFPVHWLCPLSSTLLLSPSVSFYFDYCFFQFYSLHWVLFKDFYFCWVLYFSFVSRESMTIYEALLWCLLYDPCLIISTASLSCHYHLVVTFFHSSYHFFGCHYNARFLVVSRTFWTLYHEIFASYSIFSFLSRLSFCWGVAWRPS